VKVVALSQVSVTLRRLPLGSYPNWVRPFKGSMAKQTSQHSSQTPNFTEQTPNFTEQTPNFTEQTPNFTEFQIRSLIDSQDVQV